MTTIDPMTAPAQEVYDWLAERDGFQTTIFAGQQYWKKRATGLISDANPITIDRLAEMLPKDRVWTRIEQITPNVWVAEASVYQHELVYFAGVEAVGCPTEREARARVVAAVLMRDNP